MKKIILDVDTGHDDAVAIMLAGLHKNIDILGVTVVAGNQIIEKTVSNTLNICNYLGLNTSVYQGQSKPLLREQLTAGEIHGESGLGGLTFKQHDKKIESQGAIDFIIDTLMQSKDKVYLVPTGPLTNIALALTLKPEIKNKIESIVLMGGSMGLGNVTPAAEFNIFADPEAAKIVFDSGCNLVMMGLDVSEKTLCEKAIVDRFRGINEACDLFVGILEFFSASLKKVFNKDAPPLHDPTTIAYLIDDSLFKLKKIHVDIDTNYSTPGYGRTYCDFHGITQKEPNVFFAYDIDKERFYDLLLDTFKNTN